jgi:hypothetical protein
MMNTGLRKVKKREQEGGAKCDFCRPVKVTAVWKIGGLSSIGSGLACKNHKHKLRELVETHESRLTEADYQTWMRLGESHG